MIAAVRVLKKCPLVIKKTLKKDRYLKRCICRRSLDPLLLFEGMVIRMQDISKSN